MRRTYSKSVRFLPLFTLMTWLLLTVLAFVCGPYDYHVSNNIQLYLYLFAVHIALIMGYYLGASKYGRPYLGPWRGLRIAKLSVALTFIYILSRVILTHGGDVGRIVLALTDPASAYMLGSTKGNITTFNYINIFIAPIQVIAITLGIFYWNHIANKYRVAIVSILVFLILENVGASVRAGIVFIVTISAAAAAAAYFSGRFRMRFRQKLLLTVMCILSVVAFFKYASFLIENRQAGLNAFINPITLERAVNDNLMYKLLPDSWDATATVTAFYISHGYYRLAKALEMPFVGVGFGVGSSPFLMRNFERITGYSDLEKYSYGMRLDPYIADGQIGTYWSTMYTWIASDVTFIGSIGVIFLLGYYLALSWIDALNWHNPLAVSAFACLASLVFSLPRTNPMQDGAGVTVYFGITLLWLITRNLQWLTKGKENVISKKMSN